MELLGDEKRRLSAVSTTVDEEDDAVGGLELDFTGKREREEDLYCDTIQFLPFDAAEPAWLIKLRQPEFVRPLLDVGIERLRIVA